MAEGIRFTITGNPVPWSRAGAYGLPGGGVKHYTKDKIRDWKTLAGWIAREAMGSKMPFDGCLGLEFHFCLAVSKSWPRWKKNAALAGLIAPAGKPDLDNLIKGIKDAMTGVVYMDDGQVIGSTEKKRYGLAPYVEVVVTHQDSLPASGVRKKDLEAL